MIAIRGGCGAVHPSTYRMSRPNGVDNYILLVTHTGGLFTIDGNTFEVHAGSAIVFAPNTPTYYGNPDGEYIDDWLHFDIENEAERALLPNLNTPFMLENTSFYSFVIRQVLWEKDYADPQFAESNTNALFTVLMGHLCTAFRETNSAEGYVPFRNELSAIRLDLKTNYASNPSISEQAKKLKISDSYFQHLYRSEFGVSYQKDLINIKIEAAMSFLISTDMTMDQIAELVGYNNEVHFYRQFKQIQGITPAKYRRTFGSN